MLVLVWLVETEDGLLVEQFYFSNLYITSAGPSERLKYFLFCFLKILKKGILMQKKERKW